MADLVTNLSLVKNGQQTIWNAPTGKKVKSARIRWRARPSETKAVSARNTGTSTVSLPSLPAQATSFDSHVLEIKFTVYNASPRAMYCVYRVTAGGQIYEWPHGFWLEPGQADQIILTHSDLRAYGILDDKVPNYGKTVGVDSVQGWDKQGYGDVRLLSPSCWAATWGTYVQAYPAATNVSATCEGQKIMGPATLQNGAYSSWYSISVAVGITSITLSHAMGGLGEVYYQLEITYLTIKPTWVKVDGILREVVSIHAKVDGVLRQIDDTQFMIDNSPR